MRNTIFLSFFQKRKSRPNKTNSGALIVSLWTKPFMNLIRIRFSVSIHQRYRVDIGTVHFIQLYNVLSTKLDNIWIIGHTRTLIPTSRWLQDNFTAQCTHSTALLPATSSQWETSCLFIIKLISGTSGGQPSTVIAFIL